MKCLCVQDFAVHGQGGREDSGVAPVGPGSAAHLRVDTPPTPYVFGFSLSPPVRG